MFKNRCANCPYKFSYIAVVSWCLIHDCFRNGNLQVLWLVEELCFCDINISFMYCCYRLIPKVKPCFCILCHVASPGCFFFISQNYSYLSKFTVREYVEQISSPQWIWACTICNVLQDTTLYLGCFEDGTHLASNQEILKGVYCAKYAFDGPVDGNCILTRVVCFVLWATSNRKGCSRLPNG